MRLKPINYLDLERTSLLSADLLRVRDLPRELLLSERERVRLLV